MDVEEIQVFIDEDGKVRLEVRGIKGQSCLELTEELEQLLGGEIEEREMTPESYEGAGIQVQRPQVQKRKSAK
jgi:hypothetical protein